MKKLALVLFCLGVVIQSSQCVYYGFISACIGDRKSSCIMVGSALGFALMCYGYELWQSKNINKNNTLATDKD